MRPEDPAIPNLPDMPIPAEADAVGSAKYLLNWIASMDGLTCDCCRRRFACDGFEYGGEYLCIMVE